MRALVLVFATLGALGACGDDSGTPAPGAPGGPPPAAAPPAPGSDKKLEQRLHVEDIVKCPLPAKIEGPVCDPKAPTCENSYCLETAQGFHCEPCSERDTIRETLSQRDFAPEQNRDPFQSFVLVPPGLETGGTDKPLPRDRTKECREDQMVASSYSYADLRLVGIVARGTQRQVLMMDPANFGQLIKRGDCVGKEKALVSEIGTGESDTGGYVTFVVHGDAQTTTANTPPRPDETRSFELYPGGKKTPPASAPAPDTSAPVVTPKSVAPVAPAPAPAPAKAPAKP